MPPILIRIHTTREKKETKTQWWMGKAPWNMCVCIIWREEWTRAWLSLFRRDFQLPCRCSRASSHNFVLFIHYLLFAIKKVTGNSQVISLVPRSFAGRSTAPPNQPVVVTTQIHAIYDWHATSFAHPTQSSSFRLLLAEWKIKRTSPQVPHRQPLNRASVRRTTNVISITRTLKVYFYNFVRRHSFRGFPTPSIFAVSCSIWVSCSVFHCQRNRHRLYFATSIYIPLKMRNDYSSLASAASLLLGFVDEIFLVWLCGWAAFDIIEDEADGGVTIKIRILLSCSTWANENEDIASHAKPISKRNTRLPCERALFDWHLPRSTSGWAVEGIQSHSSEFGASIPYFFLRPFERDHMVAFSFKKSISECNRFIWHPNACSECGAHRPHMHVSISIKNK